MADYAYAFKGAQHPHQQHQPHPHQQQHQLPQHPHAPPHQQQQHPHQHQQHAAYYAPAQGYPQQQQQQYREWDHAQNGAAPNVGQGQNNASATRYFSPSPSSTTMTSTIPGAARSPQQQQQQGQHSHSPAPALVSVPSSSSHPALASSSSHSSSHAPPNGPSTAMHASSSSHANASGSLNANANANGSMNGSTNALAPPQTLLWSDLEPWMDAEYVRQVCALLRWDAGVRVPLTSNANGASSQGGVNGTQGAQGVNAGVNGGNGAANGNGARGEGGSGGGPPPNNAGYAVLTFGSAAAAAGALAQVNASGTGPPMTMPNSARAFVLNWAPAVAFSSTGNANSSSFNGANANVNGAPSTTNGPFNGAPTNANTANTTHATNGNGNGAYPSSSSNPSSSTGTGGGVVSPTSPLSPVTQGFPGAFGVPPVNMAVAGMGMLPFGVAGVNGVGVNGVGVNGVGVGVNGVGGGVNGGMPGVGVGGGGGVGSQGPPQYPKEYSIFVGDLAPETSNSDLVAVFRNPVLGLRNDRAPKFIRPFASCKSAKIMLDPVTGVSRGYGFVRFTDEADQQRALIEMHGLYCLSRPMRISPATAKFKPPPSDSLPASASAPSYSSVSTAAQLPTSVSVSASGEQQQQPQQPQQQQQQQHHQARAILGNLIGPNGEQLTSTDPYNTTVFVGGLSPLVGEETLRTFFVPFGEIHYVKVPVGKHCGFVQFVKKADAERAIEKMQGFPVGGSRIRLSWGRSQYKAAQAAAQAAQAAALAAAAAAAPQPQPQSVAAPAPVVQSAAPAANANGNANAPGVITPAMLQGMTQEQAIALLQKFGMGYGPFPAPNPYAAPPNVVNGGGYLPSAPSPSNANQNGGSYGPAPGSSNNSNSGSNNGAEAYRNGFHSTSPSNGNLAEACNNNANANAHAPQPQFTDESLKVRHDDGPFGYTPRAYEVPAPTGSSSSAGSSFSPFSPDPNGHQPQQQQQQQPQIGGLYAAAELLGKRRDSYASSTPYGLAAGLPHPSKSYAPGFFPVQPALTPVNGGAHRKMSGSGSPTRGGYGGGGFAGSPPSFQINRYQSHAQTQPISRPNSGSARGVGLSGEEFDAMHDLNGTLASLDLDREREREFGLGERQWSLKSPALTESISEESTSSGGSVQFRMTMGRTPSP
ncbi:hypothetical protein DFH06DRAFT_284411 [Mycena polygramma]|nr:hypothetical protein DFH06DRAFT_284411 [Mycena polygramma]